MYILSRSTIIIFNLTELAAEQNVPLNQFWLLSYQILTFTETDFVIVELVWKKTYLFPKWPVNKSNDVQQRYRK